MLHLHYNILCLYFFVEHRLRYLTPSSFVQEEVQRAADHFAVRLDVFVETLIARAPQPVLPRLEVVPPPLPAWALCPINVVDSGTTAQNPIDLVSEDDSDDEKSRECRGRRRQANQRQPSRSISPRPAAASPEYGGEDEVDYVRVNRAYVAQLEAFVASVEQALED
jgi:hypothetical protein